MERNFDNRDFEQFLKQNADQYRMHPSEKVWNEIHNTLHSRRKWYGIATLLLLITGTAVTLIMLNPNSKQTEISQVPPSVQSASYENRSSVTPEKTSSLPAIIKSETSAVSNRVPSIIIDDVPNQDISTAAVQVPRTALMTTENNEPGIQDAAATTFEIESPAIIAKNNLQVPVIENGRLEKNARPNIEKNLLTNPSSFTAEKKSVSLPLPVAKKSAPAFTQKNKNNHHQKISLQAYFTPGVSYRRLTENKEVILAAAGGTNNIPTNLALQDVKNVVTHRPDAGFELGLAAKYPLNKIISVKAGLQFNVNKYNIRAFSYTGEPATIAIQSDNPAQQSVTRTSYYRNFNGYKPNWLTNVYLSFSVPVGAEVNFINTKKISLGIGLTLQPTYLLDNRAFLISTDFKNYAKVPDLIRRWNMNTGAEIIIGLNGGKTKWQIGPQVRYQALSSFKDKYPVKENLFNYGFKVGVTLNR